MEPTPELVDKALRYLFADPRSREEAAALVRRVCSEHDRIEARARLAVLKLSDGDLGRLADYVAEARTDWRNVLMWAESPAYSQGSFPDTPTGRTRAWERDQTQYESWLERVSQDR